MTRILFLPSEQSVILFDSPLPAAQLVSSVLGGHWLPPPPFDAPIRQAQAAHRRPPLRAQAAGGLVIVTPCVPLDPLGPSAPAQPGPPLTRRQLEVLQGLAAGLKAAQIARRLGLSTRQVYHHAAEIRRAFGVQTGREAVERGVELGYCKGSC